MENGITFSGKASPTNQKFIDEKLFQYLVKIRKEVRESKMNLISKIAQKKDVPAYIILHDTTLREIATKTSH
jgi:hypothetical protein